MILSPEVILKENDIEIKKLYRSLQKETKPLQIKIFLFDTFKLTSLTSFGEFICRRMFNKDMAQSTFVVDKFSIWQNVPLEKNTSIVVCGKESLENCLKFIRFLLKKFKMGINQVFLNFYDENFICHINDMKVNKINYWDFIDEKILIEPQITTNFYRKGQWNTTDGFIEKIKIKVNVGKLKYRVYTKGQWQKWVDNGEEAGIEDYYIKGFQFQYVDDRYVLFYQCKINNKYTNFKDVCKDKEFKYYIQDLNFELREVNKNG